MADSKKTLDVTIPEYLSVDQYRLMNDYNGDSEFGRLIHAVAAMTKFTVDEVRTWSLESLKDLANEFASISDHKQEFHSIIEWEGELYGYAPIASSTLGEYIDLENLAKDMHNNMHKVAAILYRPITSHRFKTLKFAYKQKVKMLNNKVENVFDWYTVEKYDSDKRKLREESFRDFPAHILLGAVSFFLSSVNLYSTNILSSQGKMSTRTKDRLMKQQTEILSQNIGAGGGLFTHSVSPLYYQLQGTQP
tara:strand:+ start:617 stop:1363 length:747 start_codon:yes stop_codon:yes gene_type:complete